MLPSVVLRLQYGSRQLNAHGLSASGEQARDPHGRRVEIVGRGEVERRTRGLRIMDWDNVHCLRFGLLPSLGGKGVKRQAGSMLLPRLSAHWLVTWRSIAPSLLARQSFSILRASINQNRAGQLERASQKQAEVERDCRSGRCGKTR